MVEGLRLAEVDNPFQKRRRTVTLLKKFPNSVLTGKSSSLTPFPVSSSRLSIRKHLSIKTTIVMSRIIATTGLCHPVVVFFSIYRSMTIVLSWQSFGRSSEGFHQMLLDFDWRLNDEITLRFFVVFFSFSFLQNSGSTWWFLYGQ